MRVTMPFAKIDSFRKVQESIEILVKAINNMGAENFPNPIPWNKIDVPSDLKAFLSTKLIRGGTTIKGDLTLHGNLDQQE